MSENTELPKFKIPRPAEAVTPSQAISNSYNMNQYCDQLEERLDKTLKLNAGMKRLLLNLRKKLTSSLKQVERMKKVIPVANPDLMLKGELPMADMFRRYDAFDVNVRYSPSRYEAVAKDLDAWAKHLGHKHTCRELFSSFGNGTCTIVMAETDKAYKAHEKER